MGHDFDTLGNPAPQALVQDLRGIQDTVETIAQTHEIFFRLKVQIGHAELDRIKDQRVYKTDDRMLVCVILTDLADIFGTFFFKLLQNIADRTGVTVSGIDCFIECGRRRHERLDDRAFWQDAAQTIDRDHVIRIDKRDRHLVVLKRHGKNSEFHRIIFFNQRQSIAVKNCVLRIKDLETRGFRQEFRQSRFIDKAEIDQDLAEHFSGNSFFCEGDIELVGRDNAERDQTITDTSLGIAAKVVLNLL